MTPPRVDEQVERFASREWRDWFARHPDHTVYGKCISHPEGCDRRCLEDAPGTPPRVDEQAAEKVRAIREGFRSYGHPIKEEWDEKTQMHLIVRGVCAKPETCEMCAAEAALDSLAAELVSLKDALERLADVTGNYLLWAPREKGHAAAHNRLWDAYREYEAFCAGVRSDG